MPKQTGFTLIEVLVGLAILALLVTLVSYAMNPLMAQQQIRAYAQSLSGYLNVARSAAIERQRQVVVCPSNAALQCEQTLFWQKSWMAFIDNNVNFTYDKGDILLHEVKRPTSDLIVKTTKNRDKLVYRSDGTSPASNLTFSICSAKGLGKPQAVIVSNAGRIRMASTLPNNQPIVCD